MSGLIPQRFIDDLLARINIIDIIDNRIKLKKAGKNYTALCPFHQEKSPSFSVNADKQFYYCFGCGAGGNAIGFLMEYDKLDFPQAVEELAQLAGIEVPKERTSQSQTTEYKAQYDILEQAANFFQDQLRHHAAKDRAVNYLKNRKLQGKVAQFFGLGYAPPGWDNLLQSVGTSTERMALLEKSGMLIRNEDRDSLYDRFRDRIMFPIKDSRGRVIAFGGRVLGDDKPKYLNSPETDTFHKSRELYGLHEARKLTGRLERILIVEGYMDVISLAQHGVTYAVATLGTAATAQHLERLYKTVPEVIFCFDGDPAGRKAAKRALETCLSVISDGKEARFLFLPEGEDPDTLIQKEQQQGFESRLNDALPLSEFFFRSLSEDSDLTSLDGKARFATKAVPFINEMKTSLLKQMMLDRISEITGLTTEHITHLLPSQPKYVTAQTKPDSPASDQNYDELSQYAEYDYSDQHEPTNQTRNPSSLKKNQQHRSMSIYIRLISLLMHHPELAKKVSAKDVIKSAGDPESELFYELINSLSNKPNASLSKLLIDWRDLPEKASFLITLSQISHFDPIMVGDPNELFDDAWNIILKRQVESELETLKKKPLQTLSSEEKSQLIKLTQRLTAK